MSGKRIINFLHFSATGFVWVYGNDAVSYVRPDKIVKKSECGTLKGGKLLSLFRYEVIAIAHKANGTKPDNAHVKNFVRGRQIWQRAPRYKSTPGGLTHLVGPWDAREDRSKFGMCESLEHDKKPSGKYVCKEKNGRIWQVRQFLGKGQWIVNRS
jgi:hypothetical protein